MAQSTNHLSGVEAEAGWRDIVGEVQQPHQPLSVVAVLQHGHALPVQRMVGMHNVHPVPAVVQVCFGETRHAKDVLVTQRDGRKSHVGRPHHVNLRDGGERQKVEQAIPGPDEQKCQADADG